MSRTCAQCGGPVTGVAWWRFRTRLVRWFTGSRYLCSGRCARAYLTGSPETDEA